MTLFTTTVFIENEAVLLLVTMWKCEKAFAATIYCITFWYSFWHYKVQFFWCTYQTYFGMETRLFQKIILRMQLFLSLWSFICYIRNIGVWKYVFPRAVFKIKIFQSRRSRVGRVALMSRSCRSFLTCVALMSFVLRLCRTRFARVWHSCCKIDEIQKHSYYYYCYY